MKRNSLIVFILLSFVFQNVLAQQKNDFSFVVLPDRTGGYRDSVYERAINKINLIQPDFVIGIGDYVEGYTDNTVKIHKEWDDFLQIENKLSVPFYKVAGNHDYTGDAQKNIWQRRFGNPYQYFIYNNSLFLLLNSNDGDGVNITREQHDYFKKIIKENNSVDWTFLFLHHPLWNREDDKGFRELETLLSDRNYTVFAGHTHVYNYQQKQGNDYITMATAGGSSKLRGNSFGETDHFALVTFKNKKPSIAQLNIQGILNKDFTSDVSIHQSRMIDKMLEPNVTVLKNSKKGKLIFNLENPTEKAVRYKVDFFLNPSFDISTAEILTNIPPKTKPKHVIIIDNKNNESEIIRYLVSASTVLENGDSLHLSRIHETKLIANQPFFTMDTVRFFTDKYTLSRPSEIITLFNEYSIDGTKNYQPFNQDLIVDKTSVINLRVADKVTGASSLPQTIHLKKLNYYSPVKQKINRLKSGLEYKYYEGVYAVIPDFATEKLIKSGRAASFDITKIMERSNNFALLFTGFVNIAEDGLYRIDLRSDDGSKLFLHNTCIVDNNGSHSARTRSGYVALRKGLHPIRIEYFEDFDGELLEVNFISEQGNKVPVNYFSE